MAQANGLYYEIHGEGDAPPLLLSPGLGGSGGYWAPNLDALAAGHRLILYDHRGTNRSDRALADASVEAMGDDILLLVDALGLAGEGRGVRAIGHAAGGVALLAAALKRPAAFARLVLVNAWLRADPHFLRCFETRLALLRGSGVEAYLRAQPLFLYPADWISTHLDALDRETGHQRAAFPGEQVVERRILGLAGFDASATIGTIAVPMLAIAAADDMLVPSRCADDLAAAAPAAIRTARMAWGGHACNVTDPAGFAALVLPFLADL